MDKFDTENLPAKFKKLVQSNTRAGFMADPKNFLSFGLASLLNIIHWSVLYIKIKPGQNNILLHYNVVYGRDLVDKSLYLYWIPLLALILLVINYIVASIFYKKEKLASYFLSIASISVQAVFFVATLVLISINND